jgi:hypothetical protein
MADESLDHGVRGGSHQPPESSSEKPSPQPDRK